jgi:hypothetical protein
MKVVRLADDRDDGRARVHQRPQVQVRSTWNRRRVAEGGEPRTVTMSAPARRTPRPSDWNPASRPRCSARPVRPACGRSSACPRRTAISPPSGCRRGGSCRTARWGKPWRS